MKNRVLKRVRTPASFALLYCAILNAVFADNRYIAVFAVLSAVFSGLLLVCCLIFDADGAYKTVFPVFYAAAFLSALCGVCGNIAGYRTGALLFLIISVSEMIRAEKRAGKRAFVHIASVVFAYVPLVCALCFIFFDIRPELCGNGTVYAAYNGGYGTVCKRTYTTARGYSVIYFPETENEAEFPVIAFLHGFWPYNNGDSYEDTLYYLSSCGYIVVAPNYESIFLGPSNYTECASTQIKDGIAFAEKTLKAKPAKRDGEYLIGLAGHSAGAVTVLNMCAEKSLPNIKFAVALDASDGGVDIIPKKDLSVVDKDLNILMAVGEDDNENCFRTSAFFQNGLSGHAEDKKAFYVLHSDAHNDGRVIADHIWMKDNGSTVDNLRKYGVKKWCRAIADRSFYGKDDDLWRGDGALYMGTWSDGTELKRASRVMQY